MERDKKNNKAIVLLLTTASALVWSIVAYQVLWGMNYQPVTALPQVAKDTVRLQESSIVYDEDFIEKLKQLKSPFRKKQIKSAPLLDKRTRGTKRKGKVRIPDVKYIGFLNDQSGSMAILEMKNGNTQICSVGDSLQGIHIKKIDQSRLWVTYQGTTAELQINQ